MTSHVDISTSSAEDAASKATVKAMVEAMAQKRHDRPVESDGGSAVGGARGRKEKEVVARGRSRKRKRSRSSSTSRDNKEKSQEGKKHKKEKPITLRPRPSCNCPWIVNDGGVHVKCVCKKTVKQTKKVQETARQEDSPSAVGDKMIRKTVATVVDSSDEEDAAAAGERGESTQRRWNAREAQCWRVGANVLSAKSAAHYAEVFRPYRVWVALRQRRIAAAAAKRWLRRRWTAEVRRWWTAVVDRGRPGRVRERTPEEARRVRRLRWLRAVSAEVRRVLDSQGRGAGDCVGVACWAASAHPW